MKEAYGIFWCHQEDEKSRGWYDQTGPIPYEPESYYEIKMVVLKGILHKRLNLYSLHIPEKNLLLPVSQFYYTREEAEKVLFLDRLKNE